MNSAPPSLEDLLSKWNAGDSAAVDEIVVQLYQVLHARVSRALRSERNRDILETTDLLHDLYIKLREIKASSIQGPEHFFRTAACVVRNALVDRARRASSLKGGGNPQFVTLSGVDLVSSRDNVTERVLDVVMVHRALERIHAFDSNMALHLELRLLFGMTQNEVADALKTNRTKIQREWPLARRVLLRELGALSKEGASDD